MASIQIPGFHFIPVSKASPSNWTKLEKYDFLDSAISIPIAGTELLQLAQQLPIAVRRSNDRLWVEVLTRAELLRQSAVDAAGRWTRPYMPIALRCLPFRLSDDVDGRRAMMLEVAERHSAGQQSHPLWKEDGSLEADVRPVRKLLTAAAESQSQLSNAAELLFLADLLVPLAITLPDLVDDFGVLLTVDRSRLASLSAQKLNILAQSGFVVIDLIVSLLRSADHFRPKAVKIEREVWKGTLDTPQLADIDALIRKVSRVEFELDASDLFSLDWLDAGDPNLERS